MIIDSCYEGVIKKLTEQGSIKVISEHLLSLNGISDKVLYVYGILKSLNAFPTVLKVSKCEKIATHYRNLGNKRFQQSDDYKALQYYNLSLLHAPLGSECYSLALANRSAVFFSLGKYIECLNDIEKVLSLNYPDKLKEKLSKRKANCQENIVKDSFDENSNSTPNFPFNLQDPQGPRFPCASSKLEVVFNKEMGRHVVAKTDIKVGEVLVEEDPYFTLLLRSQYLFACSYCLSRNLNLLPCNDCCFAMFCSEECKEKAWKDYHGSECPLMPTLIDMEFTKLELLALRTVIKARNDHSSWDSLFETIEKAEENEDTEYRGHIKLNNEWVYDSQYYASIHTLESNVDKRSVSDIFQKSVTAAVFLWLLEQRTSFLESAMEDERKNIRNYTAGTLLLHLMTGPTNMHGISTTVQNKEGDYLDEFSIASAPYAFHSLLNHSCAPNVVRYSNIGTGRMTLFALRPIKKGTQIFDNYGYHHALQPRYVRQKELKFQYKFMCLCEACVQDWPTYLSLKPAKNLPVALRNRQDELLNATTLSKLQKGNVATAEFLFKPLCELAEALDQYAPCIELADCQESLKQCLQIFYGVVPYGYSQLVDWKATPPNMD